MLVNNNELSNNQNLIIYSYLQSISDELNIYADEINKDDYDNWNIDNLNNNIPNNNSSFTNNNTEFSFVNTLNFFTLPIFLWAKQTNRYIKKLILHK